MALKINNAANTMTMTEVGSPATPPSGTIVLYAATDGTLHVKTDAGVNKELADTNFTPAPGSPAVDVALDQYRNIVGGNNAGSSVSATAVDNVFLGDGAGSSCEVGKENVFIGLQAGQSSVNGSYNVLIGKQAGINLGNTFHNIGIGNNALVTNSAGGTGSYNIAIGLNSLNNLIYLCLKL